MHSKDSSNRSEATGDNQLVQRDERAAQHKCQRNGSKAVVVAVVTATTVATTVTIVAVVAATTTAECYAYFNISSANPIQVYRSFY